MKVVLTGDWCPSTLTEKQLSLGLDVYGDCLPDFQAADLFVTNVETSLSRGSGPRKKQGPHLYTNPKYVELLKVNKKVVCCIANNHIADFGEKGMKETTVELMSNGFHVSGPYNPIGFEDLGVSILNMGEYEGGSEILWWEPSEMVLEITEWKSRGLAPIVMLHGGCEFYPYPNPRMEHEYHAFIDAGATLVVGTHTHVPMVCDYPVYYGLGGLLFNHPQVDNRGYYVTFDTETRECSITTFVLTEDGLKKQDFTDHLEALSRYDWTECWKAYSSIKYRERYKSQLRAFIEQDRDLDVLNFFQCESHRDVIMDGIRNQGYKNAEIEAWVRKVAKI